MDHPKGGTSYLLKESNNEKAFSLLDTHIQKGPVGMCITRNNPKDISTRFGSNIPLIWLTNQSSKKQKDYYSTSNIGIIKNRIKEFLETNEKAMILLDRADYLINLHGFPQVLRLIYAINDLVTIKDGILLLNLNPNTLSPQELSLLEQEMKIYPKSPDESDKTLPDDLHEILTFVSNEDKVTFKDVSKKFSITKTTTRKRINNLLNKNLITVDKNGRNKIVRLTEKGSTSL